MCNIITDELSHTNPSLVCDTADFMEGGGEGSDGGLALNPNPQLHVFPKKPRVLLAVPAVCKSSQAKD